MLCGAVVNCATAVDGEQVRTDPERDDVCILPPGKHPISALLRVVIGACFYEKWPSDGRVSASVFEAVLTDKRWQFRCTKLNPSDTTASCQGWPLTTLLVRMPHPTHAPRDKA